uniref:Endonuclease/exonuclease/phosphatase domain-containing protein n=1 Tax=Labrus bergylta TaxID=56723 RepID=A0A3Q3EG03_9LABR
MGDIIFLQETHLNKVEHQKLGKLMSAQVFASSTAKRGVATLIQRHVPFKVEKNVADKEGRDVLVIGNIGNKPVTLLNVYNPPGHDPEFMVNLLSILVLEAKGITIMGGDFIMVMKANDTQSKGKHKSEKTAAVIRKAEIEIGLVDIWRILNPKM